MNQRDPAKNLNRRNWFVVLGNRITSRNPAVIVLLDHPMDEEPVLSRHQHDVASYDLVACFVLYAEKIARPDRRKHAGSQRLQANCAPRGENFGCHLHLMTLVSVE